MISPATKKRQLLTGSAIRRTTARVSDKAYILSCDYSSQAPSIALFDDHQIELLDEASVSPHALEDFIPSLDLLLKRHDLQTDRLSGFVTASGPGSFTGLRCCFAALKAMACVERRPITTVASDEIRALAWLNLHPETPRVSVVTTVGKYKAILASCDRSGNLVRTWLDCLNTTPAPILLDGTTLFTKEVHGKNVEVFTSSARLIGEYFQKARTSRRADTDAKRALLEPDYFGDRWKKA